MQEKWGVNEDQNTGLNAYAEGIEERWMIEFWMGKQIYRGKGWHKWIKQGVNVRRHEDIEANDIKGSPNLVHAT